MPTTNPDPIGITTPLLVGQCKQATWENVGPKHISGVIRDVVIDPADRRRLYAVSANGGIWRLENVDDYPNTTWRPLTEELNNLRFRTMAIAPSDSNILYAANSTKELRVPQQRRVYSEIYRSADRGLNWQPIHEDGMGVVHRMVVHPENPNEVFAATSTGLWRQNNTIGSWTNLFPDDCMDVALDPDEPSNTYLGVRGQGIYKSSTAGADWPDEAILTFNSANAGSGRQTIKIALGRNNQDGTRQTPETRTVVVRFGNEICVSQTGGDDPNGWQRQMIQVIGETRDRLRGGSTRRSDTDPPQAHEWHNCLAVDPFDPAHILVGAISVFRSKDSGQTWTHGFPHHEDQHSLVFDEEQEGLVYCGNDGGIFSSIDREEVKWPSMSLANTMPTAGRGTYLAQGLITSEFRHSAVRNGRCVAAIDHTGFILSENFANRWQYLFRGPDASTRHAHESSYIFSCPASSSRWYSFIMRNGDDPINDDGDDSNDIEIRGRLVQYDFTRDSRSLVTKPEFNGYLSGDLSAPVVNEPHFSWGEFFPEDTIYDRHIHGPLAIRFSEENNERLILMGTVIGSNRYGIQSLRLAQDGRIVTSSRAEVPNNSEPFYAITFVSDESNRAFAATKDGQLFERDFSNPTGQFIAVGQWTLSSDETFVSRLVPALLPDFKLYLLSQNSLARYDDDGQPVTLVHTWPDPHERLMSLVAHPNRNNTLFLGTSRGIYLSEDGGVNWTQYRQGMPAVPVIELSFDQGYLYAATYGRGLWRCKPCQEDEPAGTELGNFDVTNENVGRFAEWLTADGVQVITGDFNGNGRTDIALVRQESGWGSIPTAFSNGDGTFTISNKTVDRFSEWAAAGGVQVVTGDFNGNGQTDIALVRQERGWGSIPIAFSEENGHFSVKNSSVGAFTDWVAEVGVQVIAGDFSGNGLTDIAMVRRNFSHGSFTIPVAFSKGDGRFEVTDVTGTDVAKFAHEATKTEVQVIAGDFNGNGRTDIALVRQVKDSAFWRSIPVAFSNGDGSFEIKNERTLEFAMLATESGVQIITGDFNGNGLTDIALIRQESGWDSIPIAFSNGDGSFSFTNKHVDRFPQWATEGGVQIITGDFNGNGRTDIALVRQESGWFSIPIAFSNGDGSFTITNKNIVSVPDWATKGGVQIVKGDFNRDGHTDIALVRQESGWSTIPVAFS